MDLTRLPDLLDFEAPYLDEKLLKLKVVRTSAEARELFAEVKKYLVLCEVHRGTLIPMFSRRVDEVWHQFVLFTAAYDAFARTYFGKFVHHDPAEAPVTPGASDAASPDEMSFGGFRTAYEELFGPLPDAWFDERSLHPGSRLLRATWGAPFAVRERDDKAELALEAEGPSVLCRVDRRAAEALRFLVSYDTFHVRELPGLGAVDQLTLCQALVQRRVLHVLP